MNQSKPALMFQGTGSDAGKSLMTAAFCRILSDEGVRVAPFKAQNMSLNSWVTAEGGEMGRAQVLQAAASRTEPQVLMNPVLLKPLGEQKSQVILRGKPLETVQARQYYENIETLRREVNAVYDELASQDDAVVLEGAGICGGFQMLGTDISDPLGLEGVPGGHCEALGLLNIRTVLEQTKILTQTEVHTSSSGRPVTGYEIHHGRSEYSEEELFVEPGLGCRNGNVWGTYLHGIFENDEIRQSFLRDCGRPETAQTNRLQSLDEALDRFAESFRQNVDVAYLKRSMGL